VGWFYKSKGIKMVHPKFAFAYPSITIDVVIGKQMCAKRPTTTIERKQRTYKVKATSSMVSQRILLFFHYFFEVYTFMII